MIGIRLKTKKNDRLATMSQKLQYLKLYQPLKIIRQVFQNCANIVVLMYWYIMYRSDEISWFSLHLCVIL